MHDFSNDVTRLDRDGFVVLDGVLPTDRVEQARRELAELFERDVQIREDNGVTEAYRADGPIGTTILTKPSHLALDVYNRSPTFDALLERISELGAVTSVT